MKLELSNFVYLEAMSNVSIRTVDHPWKGRGTGHVIHFRILHPLNFFGMAEDRIVQFRARVGPRSISLVTTNCHQVGVVKVTWRFWQISVNISKTVQDSDILAMEDY